MGTVPDISSSLSPSLVASPRFPALRDRAQMEIVTYKKSWGLKYILVQSSQMDYPTLIKSKEGLVMHIVKHFLVFIYF